MAKRVYENKVDYSDRREFSFPSTTNSNKIKSYIEVGDNLILLRGPHGTGKTTDIFLACRDLGAPLLETGGTFESYSELIGDMGIKDDGEIGFIGSVVLKAFTEGAVVSLSDADSTNVTVMKVLQCLTDRTPGFVEHKTKRFYEKHPNFCLVMSINPETAGRFLPAFYNRMAAVISYHADTAVMKVKKLMEAKLPNTGNERFLLKLVESLDFIDEGCLALRSDGYTSLRQVESLLYFLNPDMTEQEFKEAYTDRVFMPAASCNVKNEDALMAVIEGYDYANKISMLYNSYLDKTPETKTDDVVSDAAPPSGDDVVDMIDKFMSSVGGA